MIGSMSKDLIPPYVPPDDGAATAIASTSALAAEPTEPVATIVPDPEAPEPEPTAAPAAPEPPPKRLQDPLISQLTEQRARRREAEERATKAEREAAEARAVIERLSKPGGTGEGQQPVTRTPAPTLVPGTPDFEQAVQVAALNRFISTVMDRGYAKFGAVEFEQAKKNLVAFGADTYDFIGSVLDADPDRAHDLLHAIAQDGATAVRLAGMTAPRRIAELTRMSIAAQQKVETVAAELKPKADSKPDPAKPAARISAAPRPAPSISTGTTAPVKPRWADSRTEAEIDEDFERFAKRKANR